MAPGGVLKRGEKVKLGGAPGEQLAGEGTEILGPCFGSGLGYYPEGIYLVLAFVEALLEIVEVAKKLVPVALALPLAGGLVRECGRVKARRGPAVLEDKKGVWPHAKGFQGPPL